MRRPDAQETLHGTRSGQLFTDRSLRDHYGLTERECAVAALLGSGAGPEQIGAQLDVSRSTVEKHLLSLRRKLGAETTLAAAVKLAAHTAKHETGIPEWQPAPPVTRALYEGADSDLLQRLRAVANVDEAADALREQLAPDGIAGVAIGLLPLNAASYRRGEMLQGWAGPSGLRDLAGENVLSGSIARQLYSEPDRAIWLDPRDLPGAGKPYEFDLVSSCIVLGAPLGCGYVACAAFYEKAATDLSDEEADRVAGSLRAGMMLVGSSLLAWGVLAKTADLTVQEREALVLLALGHSTVSASEQLGCSKRALSETLARARQKLGAATNSEAIARAMALNALVFL